MIDACEARKDQWGKTLHDSWCEPELKEKVNIRVGKTYYRRLTSKNGIPLPWPDGMSPAVKVLARRGDWVKYIELEGFPDDEEFIDAVEFSAYFMEDEFNDLAMPELEKIIDDVKSDITVNTIDSLDAEVGFILDDKDKPKKSKNDKLPELPSTSVMSVIQIDGKDYVLSPVKK